MQHVLTTETKSENLKEAVIQVAAVQPILRVGIKFDFSKYACCLF